MRLLATQDFSAYFAMASAAASCALKPIDLLLRGTERKLYHSAPARKNALVFVVGAPRSGTTICEQVLLRHLPFAYLNNVTSLFPKSPLTATRFLGGPRLHPPGTSSFYGKTAGLRGPNDALYIWDRWFGTDRTRIPEHLDEESAEDMACFFAACEEQYKRPLLCKVNSLIASAHLVDVALTPCFFICMQRDDAYLAQSLYISRQLITGSLDRPYGLLAKEFVDPDPIRSVCKQSLFYRRLAESQRQRIGEDRFWITSYEDFCHDPEPLIDRVNSAVFQGSLKAALSERRPLTCQNRVKLDRQLFNRIESTLDELRQEKFAHPTPSVSDHME